MTNENNELEELKSEAIETNEAATEAASRVDQAEAPADNASKVETPADNASKAETPADNASKTEETVAEKPAAKSSFDGEEEDPEAERYDEIQKLAEAQKKLEEEKQALGNHVDDKSHSSKAADGREPLLSLRDIHKIYKMGSEEVRANDGITLDIYDGEFVAIVGKSGSGKSTLMNIIGALDVPTSGEYYINGRDVAHLSDDDLATIRNQKIGFIFQQYNLLPRDTILDNVALPLLYRGLPANERKEKAMASLERVGLGDKCLQHPSQLSGGQQQRVSIARALAGDPELILADEPTGALDSKTSKQVLGFLEEINNEGNTVIMITHDNSIALQAKRVVRISDGKIVYDGTAEDYAKFV